LDAAEIPASPVDPPRNRETCAGAARLDRVLPLA